MSIFKIESNEQSSDRKMKAESYASIVRSRMRERNESIRSVAKATHFSYEHVRRLLRPGTASQSSEFNRVLCVYLDLDPERLWQVAVAEKLKRRYGAIPAQMVPPADTRIADIWDVLVHEEQTQIAVIVECFAAARLARGRSIKVGHDLAQLAALPAKLRRLEESGLA
jgi:hypothetical protein